MKTPEEIDRDKLLGLSVEAVQAQLPEGMVLPASVLAEAVTAIRSGKHLLHSGPPGTGKSTVAGAICRAVLESRYRVTTATADWTTFDTIGGYVPTGPGALEFEPGVVLRCLESGAWLVIDELNRADIDKRSVRCSRCWPARAARPTRRFCSPTRTRGRTSRSAGRNGYRRRRRATRSRQCGG